MEIVIEKLTHVYGRGTPYEKKALDAVDLIIPSGTFMGLIGHTGSGKSTLIQHLNGLLKPTAGTVRVGEAVINAKSKRLYYLRKKVGVVFQYPETQLFAETVMKDVTFGPLNFDLTPALAEKRAREALTIVGMDPDEMGNRSPFSLSGGEMRRVAIAGVLAMQPQVLVLDEPTAGLDPGGKRDILDTIYRLHKEEGWTTILVTHSMEDAARYADKLAVMNNGKIALTGSPAEVFANPETLEECGLDLPEITQFIRQLNEKLDPPIPLSIFRVEDLQEALNNRLGQTAIPGGIEKGWKP